MLFPSRRNSRRNESPVAGNVRRGGLGVQRFDDFHFFGPLQLDQHVLLGREVEIERAARNPRGRRDRCDVRAGQSGPAELGHRGVVHPRPGLQPLCLTHPDHLRSRLGGRR